MVKEWFLNGFFIWSKHGFPPTTVLTQLYQILEVTWGNNTFWVQIKNLTREKQTEFPDIRFLPKIKKVDKELKVVLIHGFSDFFNFLQEQWVIRQVV